MEEKMNELVEMLTGGKLPEGVSLSHQPHLSRREAFSVIWFLQEITRVLPDNYEQCVWCEKLFDANREGYSIDATESIDDWYERIGVTQAMLGENDGANFCSPECEYQFWSDKIASAGEQAVAPDGATCDECGHTGILGTVCPNCGARRAPFCR